MCARAVTQPPRMCAHTPLESPPDTHTCFTHCSTHVWIHRHSTFPEQLLDSEYWAGYSIGKEKGSEGASLGLPLEAGLPGRPAVGVNQREAALEGVVGPSLRVQGTRAHRQPL